MPYQTISLYLGYKGSCVIKQMELRAAGSAGGEGGGHPGTPAAPGSAAGAPPPFRYHAAHRAGVRACSFTLVLPSERRGTGSARYRNANGDHAQLMRAGLSPSQRRESHTNEGGEDRTADDGILPSWRESEQLLSDTYTCFVRPRISSGAHFISL